ncbi:MAG: DNA-binding response regulator [Comamonadaceae bacterium CG1_02_60_18]|nr:MAG: DNA-binding response regulator [Comamonadaceae bacterium CG1_02_60_18]PIQ54861.1 MAG: DNA-binding response regulator [Comamonadaceae bacterium CG12_big_fil_rev_8_21_14_0_65_59_15]
MSRIFLVDDHTMVREGLRSVLEKAGHQVVGEDADPAHALTVLSQLAPDVLLLDLNLNGSSGLMLLLELQRRNLMLPTIVLTMSAHPHQVSEALRMGALGYVLKGASSRELLQAIETVRQGQRFLGEGVVALRHDGADLLALDDPLSQLTTRERQIMEQVARGQTSAAIAKQLNLSPKTVETYRSRLMRKLGVDNLPGLVRFAMQCGMLQGET